MKSLPTPDLKPHPISYDVFLDLVPEKFEWVHGYLFDGESDHRLRRQLLAILLTNEGLVRAVQLAPRERWLEALQEAEK
jgi:hypothetical protein